ncbi:MAG TPA: hypothetical protein VLU95_05790 [Candidatus Acidoferrum sp.]|nr:hypothetical protein [Candidatus Acidoferrum sp.]
MKKRSLKKDCSGQVIIITALLVALLLLSTAMYVIETGKNVPTPGNDGDNLFLAYEQSIRSTLISALANISSGGNTGVLIADLNELNSAIISHSYQDIVQMAYTPLNTAPYQNGTWISWGVDGHGISSACVSFAFNSSGLSTASNLEYNSNITTEVNLTGNYSQLNDTLAQANLTINVLNEDQPALAQNFTFYFRNIAYWVKVEAPDITNLGDGTYSVSFSAETDQQSGPLLVSMFCQDQRGITVGANATCLLNPGQLPTPSASPSPLPSPSPSPSPTPSPIPTPTDSPTPTPSPSPSPSPSPTPTPTPTPSPSPSPPLFNDSFDSKDFSLWPGGWNNNGGNENVQTTSPYGGNNVATFTLPANAGAAAFIIKDLGTNYSTLYLSGFVCLDALPSFGNYLMAGITLDSISGNDLSSACIHNAAGQYFWCLKYWDSKNNVDVYVDSAFGPNISVGSWYYLEVMCTVGGGNGEVAMWVNNTQVSDITGLTNNGDGASRLLQVGPYSLSGTLALNDYIDNIVASTSFTAEPTYAPAITFTSNIYMRVI